jgi:hypothetical protein
MGEIFKRGRCLSQRYNRSCDGEASDSDIRERKPRPGCRDAGRDTGVNQLLGDIRGERHCYLLTMHI